MSFAMLDHEHTSALLRLTSGTCIVLDSLQVPKASSSVSILATLTALARTSKPHRVRILFSCRCCTIIPEPFAKHEISFVSFVPRLTFSAQVRQAVQSSLQTLISKF